MKNWTYLAVLSFGLSACVSSETQVRNAIQKDPQLVFDAIEENPEKFIEVVNRAAQKAQQRQYEKRAAQMQRDREQDLKAPKKPQLDPSRRLMGTDSSPITIVEYADFQCPACRMGFEGLQKFKEKYKGQVQFYFKNMPLDFHKMAMPSATYFEAIRLQDRSKALKFHEFLFENQVQLKDEEFLKKAAKQVGADLNRLQKDIKSEAIQRTIAWDQSEFEKFGFTGTPVVILNGVAINGAASFEELERVLEQTKEKGN